MDFKICLIKLMVNMVSHAFRVKDLNTNTRDGDQIITGEGFNNIKSTDALL